MNRRFFFGSIFLAWGTFWLASGCDDRSFLGRAIPEGGSTTGGNNGNGTGGSGGTEIGSGGDTWASGGTGWDGIAGEPGTGGAWNTGGSGWDGIAGEPGTGGMWNTGGSGGSWNTGGMNTGGAPPFLCPTPGVGNTPTDIAAFRTAITRKWLHCPDGHGSGIFEPFQTGLEIKPDNRYWFLERDASEQLVPQTGVDFEGSVSYDLTDFGAVQTTFRSDLNVIFVAAPVITINPTMLIFKTTTSDHRFLAADQ